MVLGGQELRVFCRVSVPMLRPAAAGRDPGTGVEAQHHGLCNAVHDTSDERVHWQGWFSLLLTVSVLLVHDVQQLQVCLITNLHISVRR